MPGFTEEEQLRQCEKIGQLNGWDDERIEKCKEKVRERFGKTGAAAKTVSTGRTVPKNLKEKLAMDQVIAKPMGITPPRIPAMSDTKNNLLASDGWVKRVQNVNGVEIHYVENTKTGEVIDFKFKD